MSKHADEVVVLTGLARAKEARPSTRCRMLISGSGLIVTISAAGAAIQSTLASCRRPPTADLLLDH